MGIEDTVKISAARQLYGTSKARYDIKYISGDLGEIFGLVKPLGGNIELDEGAEHALKALEKEIADAEKKVVDNSSDWVSFVGCGSNVGDRHNWSNKNDRSSAYCKWCNIRANALQSGSAGGEIERQLTDLKSKLETKRQSHAGSGRQQRMTSFK